MKRRSDEEISAPLYEYDAAVRSQYGCFAGVDEAGRGPLVGNVVAACVVMPKEPLILWVDDSKKLSEKRRESVYAEIMERALYVGIGQATPEEIDRMDILEATKKAMREAASQVPAEVFLIDAVKNLGLNGREIPMVKGDATSYAIAASSIVAKVTRDRQMLELDKLYDDNDLNCDNFAQAVREYRCSRKVITAVANLYLRQQIMLDTY